MPDGSTSTASNFSYARMYEEQQPRLVAYARSLTRNSWTAEDLVAEAHFRVWRRLAEGHEIENVPAYLMTTVRHLASAAAGTAVRETPRDPQSDERGEVPAQTRGCADPAEQVSAVDLLVRVLGQLPERWVKALWLAEAEGQPLAAIGPQVGTKDGATAVLLHRAREGMRQAFLRTQTGAPDDPACQVHWARMPAYVRGAATERQSERLLGHVDACDDCRARLAALMSANDRLPALVGPALLVFVAGGAGKYVLTAAAAGSAGLKGGGVLEGVRHVTAGGAKAAVAAGAVVAGAAVVILALGPGYSTPTPAQRTPVAEAPAAQVPVAEGPVAGTPVTDAPGTGSVGTGSVGTGSVGTGSVGTGSVGADTPVAGTRGDDGGSGDGGTAVQPASAERGDGSSVDTRTPGDDEPAPPPSEPAAPPVPSPTAPAPEQPTPPAEDTPGKPAPPTKDTPAEPAPPANDTPAPASPSTPAPDPVSDPGPAPDPTPPSGPTPNPEDPAPTSPTPVNPTPVEDPAPANPPASTPTPATPPPTTTTPEPTNPPATADPAPDPAPNAPEPTPGDNCSAPEGPDSPVQD
ncbi:sigma factor [Streptomyces justiciae]|uniref:Sigma factor n=1 Tax=Streptomyces justiciae TaxID=2780140 RepID=A0ABU3LWV6_9ACTN|nr:sigma factor [Streptomyces justiciae]MDT7843725.1 sigma factor [Streptomyces justiciae]